MKQFIKLGITLVTGLCIIFGIVSCKPEIEYKSVEKNVYTCAKCLAEYDTAEEASECYLSHQPAADTTAPGKVKNLTAINLDGAVALKWTDPEDTDLFGIEINWSPKTVAVSRSVTPMENGSIFIAPETQIAEINNLKNGIEYTFTVKAMDLSGNKSESSTKKITPSEIKGSVLTIALTPETTAATKEDITVTVTVNTEKDRSIKTIKYAADVKELDYFTSNGTEVTNGSFTVTTNGVYTVYAQDIDGRVGLKRITVSNIDKTAPNKVTELTAVYNSGEKKIHVSWANPSDADFNHNLLSYTKAGTAIETDKKIEKNVESYEFDYETDGTSEIIVTVKTVDSVGNVSEPTSYSFTPITGPSVTKITLSRYHFAYNDADQTVIATANIANIDQIPEGTAVKFQIVNGSVIIPTDAVLDKTAGTATATLTAPNTSSSSIGTTYTVRLKIGEEADTLHTARFNVSAPPSLSNLSQSTTDTYNSENKIQIAKADITTESKLYVELIGYNIDLQPIALQYYDSTGAGYFTEPVQISTKDIAWTATDGTNRQILYTNLPLPTIDNEYTLKVLINGVAESITTNFQIYDVPKFTSFIIPKAGISKEDNTIIATVKGKNFMAPGITESSFTVKCDSKPSIINNTSVTIISDTKLNITLTIPGTSGDYEVSVISGSNNKSSELIVKDYENLYHVGDVLLKDGSIIPYNESNLNFTEEQKQNAVGVLYGFTEYGAPSGWVGLYNTEDKTLNIEDRALAWTNNNTIGFKTTLTDIICMASDEDNIASCTFTGDIDGSDNWEYICSIDPEGTANAAENYPAFDWINKYSSEFSLSGTAYETGWYMPSFAELSYICRNKTVINSVIEALNGIILDKWSYWSSSQYYEDRYHPYSNAECVNFYNNHTDFFFMSNKNRVCCVRAF